MLIATGLGLAEISENLRSHLLNNAAIIAVGCLQ